MFDRVGEQYPPPIAHPDMYYGFLAVTMVWQIAFLIISTDPPRYRPIMIAGMLEKFVYVATMGVLYGTHRIVFGQFAVVFPDFILGMLFVAAYYRTPIRA
jgi:hypothetical protein